MFVDKDEAWLDDMARYVWLAGGKGLNLARAARVLGEQVRVVAPLGGHIGSLVAELAAAEGLDLEARPSTGETRMCVSAIADDATAASVAATWCSPAANRCSTRSSEGWLKL